MAESKMAAKSKMTAKSKMAAKSKFNFLSNHLTDLNQIINLS